MEVGLVKKEIFIAFIISLTIILSFPLLPQAIEIRSNDTIEEIEEILEVEVEEIELIPDENIEEEIELEYPEDWEIVIIDEPLPVAIPTFPQVEINNPVEETIPVNMLPRTGEINSFLQGGFGALMILLGTYMNTNKQRQT